MNQSTLTPAGPRVDSVDFAVPNHYTIGRRFETFAEAVEHARSRIERFDYPGQEPDHRFSRQFVQMRQVEPIQERGGKKIASGSDGVVMTWEVFHDGTVRQRRTADDEPSPTESPERN